MYLHDHKDTKPDRHTKENNNRKINNKYTFKKHLNVKHKVCAEKDDTL